MANTFKFGGTTDPSMTDCSEWTKLAEDTDDKGNLDPDRLVQCPFDKNHQIRVCRLPYHIVKCKKNHPKLAKELKACPFNACHLLPKHELTRHLETCENRMSLDPAPGGEGTNGFVKWQVPPSTWVSPDMTENWDEDMNEEAPPFAWGQNTAFTVKPMFPSSNGPRPGDLPWQ